MNHIRNKGFTLVELIISMAFLSVLLVTISALISQVSNMYQRGVTLKSINQVGRAVASDLESDISSTLPFSIAVNEGHYVVKSDGNGGGRLCMGNYSYIWNYKNGLGPNFYDNDRSAVIHLIRVSDHDSQYCINSNSTISRSNSTELIESSDIDLAIYEFNISAVSDTVTKQSLYTIQYRIGTSDVNLLTNDLQNCKAPGQAGEDITYCAINEFRISATTGNNDVGNEDQI